MKKLYTLIATVFLTASTFAQAPEKMSYQAVVRDAANALVTNTQVSMQISILQGGDLANPGPTIVYSETQTPTTNANGLVTLEIGTGTTTDDFTAIDWANGPYFIQTGTDPTGGTTYTTLTSTSQLMSVPFALHTKHAANGLPSGGTDGQILAINASGAPEWITPSTGQTFYEDTDGDGYGDINSAFVANTAPNGYVDNNTDCDDNDITINPATVWYLDADGDNYAVSSVTQCDNPGAGYTTVVLLLVDCDDNDGTINPNTVWYLDADEDKYAISIITQCTNPGAGYTLVVLPMGDCDDNAPARNPGVMEISGNSIDDDCDGEIDELQIGQFREGGIVFHIFQSPSDEDEDGILEIAVICAVEDQTNIIGIQWGPDGLTPWAENPDPAGLNGLPRSWDGSRLTDAIIAAHGMSNAAGLARTYTGGGYTDWFLPGEFDVERMKTEPVYSIINAASLINGGSPFAGLLYWSSSELNALEAATNLYGSGNGFNANNRPKSSLHSVRAVRYLKI